MDPNRFSGSALQYGIHEIPDHEAGPSNSRANQLRQSTSRPPMAPPPFGVGPTGSRAALHLPVGPTEPSSRPQQRLHLRAPYHNQAMDSAAAAPHHPVTMPAGDSSFPDFPGPSSFQTPRSHDQHSESYSILQQHMKALCKDSIWQKNLIHNLHKEVISFKKLLGKLEAQVTFLMAKLGMEDSDERDGAAQ